MDIYIPYTYLIGWSILDKWYYGVRYGKGCSPKDLWNPYRTSSKHVHHMIEQYGDPDVIQIRKTFDDPKKAHQYEQRVLGKLDVLNNEKWINCGIGGTHSNPGNKKPRTAKQIESARKSLTKTMSKIPHGTFYGKKHTRETIEKLSNRELETCPWCKHSGKGNVMKRWHYDNCKQVIVMNYL